MSDVPDFLVERLALGELSPAQAEEVRRRLGPDAQARLDALAAENRALLEALPPERVAAEVRRRIARVQPSPAPAIKWWIPTMAVAAAVVVALLWWRRDDDRPGSDRIAQVDPPPVGDDGGETIYIKGDARLFVDRVAAGTTQRLADGDEVAAGDTLQVQYHAGDRDRGVIVSIDGLGVATLHHPAQPSDPPRLRSGGAVSLDHSYELDDAPRFERFFFVTAGPNTELQVAAVMQAAQALAKDPQAERAALVLPAGYEQTSLLLRKR